MSDTKHKKGLMVQKKTFLTRIYIMRVYITRIYITRIYTALLMITIKSMNAKVISEVQWATNVLMKKFEQTFVAE